MKLRTGWIVLSLALGGCHGAASAKEEDAKAEAPPPVAVEVAKVERRPIRTLLEVTGSFAPTQGGAARLAAAAPGRVSKVLVREGDRVHKGDLLATIDSQVQQSQQSAAQAAATAATQQAAQSQLSYRAAAADQAANVRTAEQALQTAKVERDGNVTQAKFDYETALADLRRIRNGARPQELAQVHQTVLQAQATRDRAKIEVDRNEALAKEGYVAKRDLDDSHTALSNAEATLTSALAAESLLKEGARPEEIRTAELKAAATRQAVGNAQRLGDQKIAQAETALAQARQAALNVRAQAQNAAANESLARQKTAEAGAATTTARLGEIRAPYDARVSRRLLNPGDFADTTNPVLEITATSATVDFVASVPAADALGVAPGMAVEIDLAPEKAVGHVVSVSPADAQTGLASVRIATGVHAVAGAFARGRIVLAHDPAALAVPKEALLDREGASVVFVVSGDAAKMQKVELGAEDNGWVAVKKGVKAGDTLVKLGQHELSDGAKVTTKGEEEKP